MGYRIAYHTLKMKPGKKEFSGRLPVLVLLSVSLFVFLVEALWPEGAAFLRESVFFSGKAVAVSALNDLAEELYAGASPITAYLNFCRDLVP